MSPISSRIACTATTPTDPPGARRKRPRIDGRDTRRQDKLDKQGAGENTGHTTDNLVVKVSGDDSSHAANSTTIPVTQQPDAKNLDMRAEDKQTLLTRAVDRGNPEAVKAVLAQGHDPDAMDRQGRTPLGVVAEKGNYGLTKLLVAAGANVNGVNYSGLAPISISGNHGHSLVVRLLAESGACLEAVDSAGCTPLFNAVERGDQLLVVDLIKNGANVNTTSIDTDAPLDFALRHQLDAIVEVLRDAGAKPARDEPAHLALTWNDVMTQRVLSCEERGCQLTRCGGRVYSKNDDESNKKRPSSMERDEEGQNGDQGLRVIENGNSVQRSVGNNTASEEDNPITALPPGTDTCAQPGPSALPGRRRQQQEANLVTMAERQAALFRAIDEEQTEFVEQLLQCGADPNTHYLGIAPLSRAAKQGNCDITKSLLNAGARINAQDRKGLTAIHSAAWAHQNDVVVLLAESGADVNLADCSDYAHAPTPLFNVVADNNESLARILISMGANVNYRNITGKTPLSLAIEGGYERLAALLITAGANTVVTTNNGKTMLHEAVRTGKAVIVDKLIKAGAGLEPGGLKDLASLAFGMDEAVCRLISRAGQYRQDRRGYIQQSREASVQSNNPLSIS